MLYSTPVGDVKTIVPVGMAHVGCTVTLAIGVAGGSGHPLVPTVTPRAVLGQVSLASIIPSLSESKVDTAVPKLGPTEKSKKKLDHFLQTPYL
jgi:hypothetical protein